MVERVGGALGRYGVSIPFITFLIVHLLTFSCYCHSSPLVRSDDAVRRRTVLAERWCGDGDGLLLVGVAVCFYATCFPRHVPAACCVLCLRTLPPPRASRRAILMPFPSNTTAGPRMRLLIPEGVCLSLPPLRRLRCCAARA